ncbi:MAG: class I SAM-dependent methyltransferase [Acidobacteria bacterium]|nr:class I SAM-dependent methyltransferase [Acidobacteriota bacterium]
MTSSPSVSSELLRTYYESRPGWVDGTTEFRRLIEERLRAGSRVLDVGAGAGGGQHLDMRAPGRRVVGIDVAPEVLHNPHLDEARCCSAAHMPFGDAEFDLAFSDYVFEHLPDPEAVVREIHRVLKPEGQVVLRTPNKWHYVPLLARLLPQRLHGSLLSRCTERRATEVFPTFYRCNTGRALRKVFEQAGFVTEVLWYVEKEPSYFLRHPLLFRAGVGYERLVNSSRRMRHFRSNLFAAFCKARSA